MMLIFYSLKDNARLWLAVLTTAFLFVFLGTTQTVSADTLFFDDFESGDYSAWDGAGADWYLVNYAPRAYSGSIRSEGRGDATTGSVLYKNLDTTGYENINLSFWYNLLGGGLEVGEDLDVDYTLDGGLSWTNLVRFTDGDETLDWTNWSGLLPAGADDNPQFGFRFQTNANSSSDVFMLEDVEVTGDLLVLVTDIDGDGADDDVDNCPDIPNPGQEDLDNDGVGDTCDADIDGDEVDNDIDNCPLVNNADQANNDGDNGGDACDPDDDNDGVADDIDNCPLLENIEQADLDNDGEGDACDPDDDNDGVDDVVDNCPLVANPEQTNFDGDNEGDACDSDVDGDGVANDSDMCSLSVADQFSNWERAKGQYAWNGEGWISSGKGDESFMPDINYTYGCSGTQILDWLVAETGDDYGGHYKHGLSKGLIEDWRTLVSSL